MANFADLHCHPDGKNYYKYSVGKDENFNAPEAHLWTLPLNKYRNYIKGLRGTHYSQSDIGRCVLGETNLVFASIYPFEQGFISTWKKDGSLRKSPAWLVNMGTRYTYQRIAYVQSYPEYNYLTELTKEWEFIQRKSGQVGKGTIRYHKKHEKDHIEEARANKTLIKKRQQEVSGIYWILAHDPEALAQDDETYGPRRFKKAADLDEILNTSSEVALVLTIEGMHSLSMHNSKDPASRDELMVRINEVKKWPVFFITFAHHFNNNLCAHAKSFFRLPKILGIWDFNPDQSLNRNVINDGSETRPDQGFTDLGFEALEKLLSIRVSRDDAGSVTQVVDDPSAGRRILADVKHMAATARRELYEIVQVYNEGKVLADRIPIIASHIGYSGIEDLATLIERCDRGETVVTKKGPENDVDVDPNYGKFNPWNINMSDEDVRVICHSGGLLGLSLDQRILGVMHPTNFFHALGAEHRKSKEADPIELIMNNILHMADTLEAEGGHRYDPDGHTFWHCLSLGSDFDGGIDPVNTYPTVMQYRGLRNKLTYVFKEEGQKWNLAKYNITPQNAEEVLDLICFGNARRLVELHFDRELPVA